MVTIRLLHGLLWVVVAAGPLTAVAALAEVATLRSQIDAVAAPVEIPAATARIEGVAEIAVADYLTSGGADDGVRGGSGWRVTATVSLGADEVAPGLYAVTVAADVTPIDPARADPGDGADAAAAASRMVFSIGVIAGDTGWVTTAPPSLIAHPAVTPPLDASPPRSDGLDSSPGLDDTVSRFLAAFLAGDGELARYTAPDVAITPVTPAPFVTVEVTSARSTVLSDGSRQVAVVVEGVDPADRAMVLAYTLGVVERDGRWEVTELLSTPPLTEPTETNGSSQGGSS